MDQWNNLNTILNTQHKPTPRWGHSGTTITHPYLLMFGGYSQSKYYNDTWLFNWQHMAWYQLQCQILPQPRSNSTLSYSSGKIIMFGGGAASNVRYNDVWQLEINFNTYQAQWKLLLKAESIDNYTQIPWPRTYHTGLTINSHLVIHGGEGYGNDLDDLWSFNISKLQWKEIKTTNTPKPRRFHSSINIAQMMYIIGGCYDGYTCINDVYRINLHHFLTNDEEDTQYQWQNVILSDKTIFIPRWGHMTCQINGNIYIFGGRSFSDHNDVILLETNIQQPAIKQLFKSTMSPEITFENNTKNAQDKIYSDVIKVKKVRTNCTPKGRRRGCMWVVGSCMIVHGGFNGTYLDDLNFINLHKTQSLKFQLNKIPQYIIQQTQLDMSQYDVHLYTHDKKILHISTNDIRYAFSDQIKMVQFMEVLAEMDYYLANQYIQLLENGELKQDNTQINRQVLAKYTIIYANCILAAAQKRILHNILKQQIIITHNNPLKPLKVSEYQVNRIFQQLQNDCFNNITIALYGQQLYFKANTQNLCKRSFYFRRLIQSFNQYCVEPIMLYDGTKLLMEYKVIMIYLHYGHIIVPYDFSLLNLTRCYQIAEMYTIEGAKIILLQQILNNVNKSNEESYIEPIKSQQLLEVIMELCLKGDDIPNLKIILQAVIGKIVIDLAKIHKLKKNNYKITKKILSNISSVLSFSNNEQKNKQNINFKQNKSPNLLKLIKNQKQNLNQKNIQQNTCDLEKEQTKSYKIFSIEEQFNDKIQNMLLYLQKLLKKHGQKIIKQKVFDGKKIVQQLKQLYKLELIYYNHCK